MLVAYIVALGVGGTLVLASLVMGGKDKDFDKSVDKDFDLDADHDHDHDQDQDQGDHDKAGAMVLAGVWLSSKDTR